jgi:hypothetical protein
MHFDLHVITISFLSPQARLESLFRILAGLFELFLFIYIGVSLFLNKEVYNIWTYTVSDRESYTTSLQLVRLT